MAGCVALVTGASSGIGRAIAVELARHEVQLCVVGRNGTALGETAAEARAFAPVREFTADLTVEANLESLSHFLNEETGRLDILIHSAGIIYNQRMEDASIDDLDRQYATNVRAPYRLTQRLLPLLTVARGQVVFINSSAGLKASRADVGQYAATKHALRAVADSLREEVNAQGVRVLTVYLGRTATPMQESLFRQEQKAYSAQTLLQPEDVASVVVNALSLPPTAEVTEISIRPMLKTS